MENKPIPNANPFLTNLANLCGICTFVGVILGPILNYKFFKTMTTEQISLIVWALLIVGFLVAFLVLKTKVRKQELDERLAKIDDLNNSIKSLDNSFKEKVEGLDNRLKRIENPPQSEILH